MFSVGQPSGPNKNPEDTRLEETEEKEEKETPLCDSVSPPVESFTLCGGDYVRLPGRVTSIQDLVSHADAGKNTNLQDNAVQNQQHSETSAWQDYTVIQPTNNSLQTPSCTSMTVTAWPQGGAIQPSGYCHIPTAHIGAVK